MSLKHSASLVIALLSVLAVAPLLAQAGEEPIRTTAQMSARVDELIDARLRQDGVSPAAPADDAQFLRRASLDLNGVIPAGSEVSAFLKDAAGDRRAKLIDRLLANPRYATHLA
ncbi:MAG: DUF1549 domain-containing protein, partial [Candidatus Saccharimonadales bacterium]